MKDYTEFARELGIQNPRIIITDHRICPAPGSAKSIAWQAYKAQLKIDGTIPEAR
jgi:hypothetical protein